MKFAKCRPPRTCRQKISEKPAIAEEIPTKSGDTLLRSSALEVTFEVLRAVQIIALRGALRVNRYKRLPRGLSLAEVPSNASSQTTYSKNFLMTTTIFYRCTSSLTSLLSDSCTNHCPPGAIGEVRASI